MSNYINERHPNNAGCDAKSLRAVAKRHERDCGESTLGDGVSNSLLLPDPLLEER